MDRASAAILLIATGVKVLLFPAYRSTDFEVHRNWLAITHSKPWTQWYSDQASPSEWTLDYPPLFAAFEWFLSQIARFFDPEMLDPTALDYASPATIAFQRISVILTEAALLAATAAAMAGLPAPRRRLALFLVAVCPGLIIVDNIHFQYNGFLLGIFLFAIHAAASGQELLGAAFFAALLCFKHIFLYSAPAFFVFLLRHYCRGPLSVAAGRFVALGAVVAAVVVAALGPFFAIGQGPQMARRLFPVSRGLMHAYWAPNFWALYAAVDKIAVAVLRRAGPAGAGLLRPTGAATLTGGLVGEAPFALLPTPGSKATAIAVLAAMAPGLAATWRQPLPGRFARAVAYTTLSAFLFGYHVHEKAILMPLIPLAVLAASGTDANAPGDFAFLTIVGTYSLFPLLHRPQEYGIKAALLVTHLLIALPWLRDSDFWDKIAAALGLDLGRQNSGGRKSRGKREGGGSDGGENGGRPRRGRSVTRGRAAMAATGSTPLFSRGEAGYLWGLVPLETYCSIGHAALLGPGRLPFLPLALTSVYCAAGVVYCWLKMTARYCAVIAGNSGPQRGKARTA